MNALLESSTAVENPNIDTIINHVYRIEKRKSL